MKSALVLFSIFLYLHPHADCAMEEGRRISQLLGGGGKAADTGKAVDGSHGLANVKGGTHLDPAHAGGGLDGMVGGLGGGQPLTKNTHISPETHLPSATGAVTDSEKAAAITVSRSGKLPQKLTEALDSFAMWAPNLYRRLRTVLSIFKTIKLQDVDGFKLKFQGVTPEAQFRMVIDTFHTFTSARSTHSAEEFGSWAKGIGEAMKVTDKEALQSTLVETQMQKELCNLFLVSSKRRSRNPLRDAHRQFTDLQVGLFDRVRANRQKFYEDGSYRRIEWGEELMNINKQLILRGEQNSDRALQRLKKDKLTTPYVQQILAQERKQIPLKEALKPLERLIGIVEDATLREHQLTGHIKQPVNPYGLDQRTAAIESLLFIYQSRALLLTNPVTKEQAEAMTIRIYHAFREGPTAKHYLYPHWMKMQEALDPVRYLGPPPAPPKRTVL
ncbi:hypothetical protein O181_058794 [Austropuccinia psidii MF-1]|uniref:Uncharacterized protein n=1 Tax=Austropuccinia psidii MF-1 TaxID=1389203 RepID=A0A9Q3ED70_9BASI|nr:hypothetical protein [Austropuccinia psidii MF-1]